MPASPDSLSFAPELPLKFVGGDPSVDFVNTVDWTVAGLKNDRLVDYQRVIEWANRGRVLDRSTLRRLRETAGDRPRAARSAYAQARWARWVLQRVFASVATGKASVAALDDFNRLLRDAAQYVRLVWRGPVAVEWQAGRTDDLNAIVWTVTRAAARLLETEAPQLRICAGLDCGWMYVDRSRNRLRRWCQMQTCGTVAKSRRRAARVAASNVNRAKA
jgi:predicted RNA-binding Zn ribbon-like protein